ncbi:M protein [Amycolatopsis sp. WQ 127309]|uniref:M protein n=1 Tax=Amycolatopsis sp. WQ 127309 TaxID=2932773 RepID=UPI001FF34123|nr:M protein [Amycolatopsis sp. WQ 127309]UOZ06710.1 M protein [Amycolatopsis sp. WQ 127309]
MAPGGGEDVARTQPGFDQAWRGFHRAQVVEYVEWAEAEIRRLTDERDAAARRAAAFADENRELRVKIDRISRTPIAPDALQERSRRMIELTREEATEITGRARENAERIRRDAELEAVRLTEKEHEVLALAEAERERQRVEHEELLRATEQRRRELDEAAAHRRARQEEDHTRAITARRTEAARELAEQDAAARAKAAKLVADATQRKETLVTTGESELAAARATAGQLITDATRKGETLVTAAEREVAALTDVRDKLHASLLGCRGLLAEAAVALDEGPSDPEATLPMAKRVPVQRRSPADDLSDAVG